MMLHYLFGMMLLGIFDCFYLFYDDEKVEKTPANCNAKPEAKLLLSFPSPILRNNFFHTHHNPTGEL